MWKSLSRLTCLSGKKTAAPLRTALTASLCKAFSTNVSPSEPSTTETQRQFIVIVYFNAINTKTAFHSQYNKAGSAHPWYFTLSDLQTITPGQRRFSDSSCARLCKNCGIWAAAKNKK